MKKVIALIFNTILISAFGANLMAQTMNEDFRKTAPQPLAPVSFNIPKPYETTLSNGLKIVIFEDKRLPIVSYRLAFNTGQINDPKDGIGINQATAALLNEGTKSYSSKELAEQIERLGASVSAGASSDNTIISASSLNVYAPEILKIIQEMALYPTFPESELKLYQQNTIENLKFQRSQPDFLANEQVSRIIYGTNPYRVVSPTAADVQKLTRDKLVANLKEKFTPSNATLIIVGDVKRDAILKDVKTLFADWKDTKYTSPKFDAPPTRSERTLTVVDRPGSAQSNIVLANIAIDRSSTDYFPLLVMNQILGAGGSSRLFMNLREAKGYTYGAYSALDTRRLTGSFGATAQVRSAVTGDSLKEFFYELNRVRDEKVSAQELTDAQNYLTGVFPLRAETQEGLTNQIVTQELYKLPADYLQTYRDKVKAVTLDDIERVAKKYITPDKMAIVVVGDAGAILPQIKTYAKTIEVYDTEGKAVDLKSYDAPTAANADEAANVAGKWNLTIDFNGQQIPVTMTIVQDKAAFTGTLDSMLGKGDIKDGKINGKRFVGNAKIKAQGQDVDLNVSGTVDGDKMKGTINAESAGLPALPFTGTKDK